MMEFIFSSENPARRFLVVEMSTYNKVAVECVLLKRENKRLKKELEDAISKVGNLVHSNLVPNKVEETNEKLKEARKERLLYLRDHLGRDMSLLKTKFNSLHSSVIELANTVKNSSDTMPSILQNILDMEELVSGDYTELEMGLACFDSVTDEVLGQATELHSRILTVLNHK